MRDEKTGAEGNKERKSSPFFVFEIFFLILLCQTLEECLPFENVAILSLLCFFLITNALNL